MTLLDRDPSTLDVEALMAYEDDLATAPPAPDEAVVSDVQRVLIATLAIAAGAIHLVMVPAHANEWMPEGIAFALAGWSQVGLALWLLARPRTIALRLLAWTNVAFIVAWGITRVSGMPFGPSSGHVETAGFVDLTCVALEVALVVACYEALIRPNRGGHLSSQAKVMLSIIPVGILVLTTAALVSPSATSHTHGGEVAAHDDGNAAAGHDHGATAAADPSAAAGAGAGHDHGNAATATPVDDKGLSKIMNGQGEGGGHSHVNTNEPVDPETQAKLDAQLDKTKLLIAKFPTVKDAEAAGYRRSGPFAPGLGTHYTRVNVKDGNYDPNTDGVMEDKDLDRPTLIYDGYAPDSPLAGFMYQAYITDPNKAPEGFAGPNDHWHFHTNVCLVMGEDGSIDAPLGADTSATKELCDKYKGMVIQNTGYMVHVWTVPGYESSQGVFSNVNPKITCPNDTYYIVKPEEVGLRKNACLDVNE